MRDAAAATLQWSRAAIDAVRRIDEFVVRYLDVARCGLWTVASDGRRAICVDVFVRDTGAHRREPDRDGIGVVALHRRLEAHGIAAVTADAADAGLLAVATSGALAVALRRGERVLAYLCAEQTGAPRPWTADERCFMRSMTDVVREVLMSAGDAGALPTDAALFDRLPVVVYRAANIGNVWTLMLVSDAAERVLGARAADLIGQPLEVLRKLLADAPPPLPDAGEFEHGYRLEAAAGRATRRLSEKGRIGIDAASGAPVLEALIADISTSVDAVAETNTQFELLTHVSHELRTPLNAMLGFAQLIELDAAGTVDQRREYVTQIQRAGRHLLEVIRDTMDLTRLQAAPIELQLEALPLAKAVEDCLPMVSNQAAQSGVRLINAVRDPRLEVIADPRRLHQALVNLLSNAVKYNRRGGSVYIESEAHGDSVRLRVTDTGVGLSAQQSEALFQPFNRLGMERSEIEGVGLGLVITKRLIEAMSGHIAVTSQAGTGSTFEVTLPRPST